MALAAFEIGPMRGDYTSHAANWRQILDGENPWTKGNGNNYGPLFNALAIPFAIHPLEPKVLYAIAWAAVLAWIIGRDRRIGLSLLPLGVLQSCSVHGGQFDIVLAIFMVLAMRARTLDNDTVSGAWIAAGVLLKFMPMVMLPFLAIDARKIRWKLVAAAAIMAGLGFGLSCLAWGWRPTLRPLVHAGRRPSDWVSGFAFLRLVVGVDLDFLCAPLTAASLLALLVWHRRRPDPVRHAIASIGVVLAFYRHSGLNYPVALAVPAAWYASESTDRLVRISTVCYVAWAATMWLAVPFAWETWGDGPHRDLVKSAWGLPTFIATVALVASLIAREQETR